MPLPIATEIVAPVHSQPGRKPPSFDLAVARLARAAHRADDLARQAAATEVVASYTLMPAIGRTGGADNLGWELHPPAGVGPVWFLASREQAVAAIPRHRARYGSAA